MANTKEEKVVYKDDIVTIEYTSKARFGKVGSTEKVHRILAEKLVNKGVVKIVK